MWASKWMTCSGASSSYPFTIGYVTEWSPPSTTGSAPFARTALVRSVALSNVLFTSVGHTSTSPTSAMVLLAISWAR